MSKDKNPAPQTQVVGDIERMAKAMAARGYCRINRIDPDREKVEGTDHFEKWFASDPAMQKAYREDAEAARAALASEGRAE